jgi:hypothetical protein
VSLSPEAERKRKERATRRKARVEKFMLRHEALLSIGWR